jgi:hypothetical protein
MRKELKGRKDEWVDLKHLMSHDWQEEGPTKGSYEWNYYSEEV